MSKLILATLGLLAFVALWKKEAQEDGMSIALSPFIAALALEMGALLLRGSARRAMRSI